jgi:hypothetical protein
MLNLAIEYPASISGSTARVFCERFRANIIDWLQFTSSIVFVNSWWSGQTWRIGLPLLGELREHRSQIDVEVEQAQCYWWLASCRTSRVRRISPVPLLVIQRDYAGNWGVNVVRFNLHAHEVGKSGQTQHDIWTGEKVLKETCEGEEERIDEIQKSTAFEGRKRGPWWTCAKQWMWNIPSYNVNPKNVARWNIRRYV